MNEVIKRAGIRTSRRTFLGRALAAIFGVFAGLSVGVPAVQAGSCSGPFGSGYCGSSLCNGYRCGSSYYTSCGAVSGYGCPSGGACWNTSGGHRCCDCRCVSSGYVTYCYCHGSR